MEKKIKENEKWGMNECWKRKISVEEEEGESRWMKEKKKKDLYSEDEKNLRKGKAVLKMKTRKT